MRFLPDEIGRLRANALKACGVITDLVSGLQIKWEVDDDKLQNAVRFGVHYFNSEQEINIAADHIA